MASMEKVTVGISQADIERIRAQVERYRWPPEPAGADWRHGVPPATMRALCRHWLEGFDWRVQQQAIDRFEHFVARIDDASLHFVRVRATRPASPAGAPIVLLHGWPSSFVEYLPIAERLAAPPDGPGRDVVVVSLPGFGFSSVPSTFIGPRAAARLVHALMSEVLGHPRYFAHGSDWGAIIAGWLGFDQPQSVAGIHMTMVSPRFVAGGASEPAEQQWLAGFRDRFEDDGAYFRLQTSRPLTFGFALNDSPVGLLAWFAEKWVAWSDPARGDAGQWLLEPAEADRLLTTVMIHLATGTAASAAWLYRGLVQEGPPGYPGGQRVQVPVAFAATRDPVFAPPPRSLVEKAYNIVRWTAYARGGHFPAMQSPDELVADLQAFAAAS